MKKLDINTLSEFNDLVDSKVYDYLSQYLEEVKVGLINAEKDEAFRTLQGKAQVLSEILNVCNDAKIGLSTYVRGKGKSNLF